SRGAAYAFVRSGTTWHQQTRITAGDAAASDELGTSMALSGNTALVGAPGKNSSTGAVYVLVPSGTRWLQQARLTASDATARSQFGFSAAFDGDTALVGAPGTNGGTGAAYVFVRTGTRWLQQARLRTSDSLAGGQFGFSVAFAGDTALVGAPGTNGGTGAAYVFVRRGTRWLQQARLRTSDGLAGGQFGFSVAFAGDTALVGAPGTNGGAGAAYVFVRRG